MKIERKLHVPKFPVSPVNGATARLRHLHYLGALFGGPASSHVVASELRITDRCRRRSSRASRRPRRSSKSTASPLETSRTTSHIRKRPRAADGLSSRAGRLCPQAHQRRRFPRRNAPHLRRQDRRPPAHCRHRGAGQAGQPCTAQGVRDVGMGLHGGRSGPAHRRDDAAKEGRDNVADERSGAGARRAGTAGPDADSRPVVRARAAAVSARAVARGDQRLAVSARAIACADRGPAALAGGERCEDS